MELEIDLSEGDFVNLFNNNLIFEYNLIPNQKGLVLSFSLACLNGYMSRQTSEIAI